MRQRLPIRSLAAVALAGAVLSGCGGSSSDPKDGVRKAMQQFVNDVLDGNYAGACALMTSTARGQLGGSQCSQRLGQAMSLASSSQKAQARKQAAQINSFPVSIHGNTATVSNPGGGSPTALVRQGDHWLIGGGASK